MSLMRYDPFQEMREMMDRMQALMRSSLAPLDGDIVQPEGTNPLAVDMTSDDKHIIVRTALPGVREDEVNVDVSGNVLTISAETRAENEDRGSNWYIREMRYGRFSRSVPLPEEVNIDKADATLENGILTVRLPKKQPNPIQKIAVRAKKLLGGKKEES